MAARALCVGVSSACCALLLLGASTVHADDATQARFHDELARAHYAAGRYEAAAREFFLEQRLAPNPRVTYNIALCFDQLGQDEQAFFHFREYLAADENDERRAFALRAVERLKPRIARVRVISDPPGAQVFVDLKEHGSYGTTPLELPLAAGPHTLWMTRADHREVRVELQARKGEVTEERVRLVPVLGRLRVRTSTLAEVRVSDADGRTVARERSGLDVKLPPAIYVVDVSAEGYRPRRDLIRVTKDALIEHQAPLERLPGTARMTVTSNVPGAVVFLDGAPHGFAPTVLTQLKAGPHEIELSYDKLSPWRGRFEVGRGSSGFLTATLEEPQRTRRDVSTWIIGGAGVAALIAAVPTTVFAVDKRAEFDRAFEEASANPRLGILRSEGATLNAVADGLWVGGTIALATSIILYFATERRTPVSRATMTWDVP